MMLPLCFNLIYCIKDHSTYEHDDLFYRLGVSQLLMIYLYACLCWVWTLKNMIDEMFCFEQGALEHMGKLMFCVERKSLEHRSFETFGLSVKL